MLLLFTGRVLRTVASCRACAVALSNAALPTWSRCKWDMCILTVIAAGRGGKTCSAARRKVGGKVGSVAEALLASAQPTTR